MGVQRWYRYWLAEPAQVLILPQVEAVAKFTPSQRYGWWHPLICLKPLRFFPKHLSFSLPFSRFMVNVVGCTRACPSLRKATRCIPDWWSSCWTRTVNGKGEHPSMCRIQEAGEDGQQGLTLLLSQSVSPKWLQMPSQGPTGNKTDRYCQARWRCFLCVSSGSCVLLSALGSQIWAGSILQKAWNNLKSVKFGSHHYTSKSWLYGSDHTSLSKPCNLVP